MNCDPKALVAAARCYACVPKPMQQAVLIYLLMKWASGASGCIPPPAFDFVGETHDWQSIDLILQWTCQPSNGISSFLVNYGSDRPDGPFPMTTNTITGIDCPDSGPFISTPTHVFISGLLANTIYYFQAIALTASNCPGSPVYFSIQTADMVS